MPIPVGEAASLGAAACFAVGLTLYRRDVTEVGAREVNLFKGVAALALFGLVLLATGARPIPADALLLLSISGILGLAVGDTFIFRTLALLGPHRTAMFGCLGPVFTSIGAWTALGEPLRGLQILGLALTLSGLAAVEARPGGRFDPRGIGFGLLSALCHSAGVLLSRKALATADPLPATAVRLAASTAVLALLFRLEGRLVSGLRPLLRPVRLRRLLPAVLVGSFLGLFLLILGIQKAHPGVANTLHSATPLFTLPLGAVLLGERPGGREVAGSLAAVTGVALLFFGG